MKVVIGEDGLDPAVQAYLDGLSRSELHELVLTLAECSETVRRTLEAVADLAGDRRGAAGEDPVRRAAALLSAPKGYEDYESYDFEYGEYTDNGYAADILDFLDELETLIDDGGADAAAPPLRMIITRLRPDLYEGRGDRDGLMERACDRAAELYARACREGRPDVGALAAWLAQFRLEVLSCPELALTDFLPALGEEGLAVYREAVEAAPQTSARLVLQVELADADGDVDRAVRLLGGEDPRYASIVERLLEAGRGEEAMAWLDRAVAAGGRGHRQKAPGRAAGDRAVHRGRTARRRRGAGAPAVSGGPRHGRLRPAPGHRGAPGPPGPGARGGADVDRRAQLARRGRPHRPGAARGRRRARLAGRRPVGRRRCLAKAGRRRAPAPARGRDAPVREGGDAGAGAALRQGDVAEDRAVRRAAARYRHGGRRGGRGRDHRRGGHGSGG